MSESAGASKRPFFTSPYSDHNVTSGVATVPQHLPKYSPVESREAEQASSTTTSSSPYALGGHNYGLMVAVFFLYSLLAVKLAESLFPVAVCSSASLDAVQTESCETDNVNMQNYQYLAVLAFGVLGVILAVLLSRSRFRNSDIALALCYSGFATIVFDAYSNSTRLTSVSQAIILSILLIAFMFLPYFSNQVVLSPPSPKNRK